MRKLEKCPACKTRSEKSKSSCLLVSEHIGKYNMVDSSIFDVDGSGMEAIYADKGYFQ